MEKKQFSKGNNNVWDCGSALYDSYELDSFKSQLNSAIANSPRSLSMPHLTERNGLSRLQPQPQQISNVVKSPSKISRPFHKFFRFLFKSTNKFRIISNCNSHSSNFEAPDQRKSYSKDRFYVVYDKSDDPVLSTIPELPEFEVSEFMPEVNSLVRKSASERFTRRHTGIGVSCA